MSFGRMVFVLLLCCGGGAAILADVRVASPFGDNMVLQRARPVPVWGTAAAGEAVTVTFGAQVVHTAADARGQWQLRLAPLTASSVPATLVVAGTNTLNFTNVLVGEVWVCSGQSNMEWALGSTEHAASAIAAADNAQIRLCTVAHAVALTPQTTCACAWVVCWMTR